MNTEEAASTEPVEQPAPVVETPPVESPCPEVSPQEYRVDGDYASGPVELRREEDDMPPLKPEALPELGEDDTKPEPGDDPEADLKRLEELESTKPEPLKLSTMEPVESQPVTKEKPKLRSQGCAQRMPGELRPD